MDEYKKYLKQDQTNWLLEKNSPSVLTTLTKLGCYNKQMHDAVRYLIKKQTKDGKWKLQKSNDNLMVSFGVKGEPSKWVTLRAMML